MIYSNGMSRLNCCSRVGQIFQKGCLSNVPPKKIVTNNKKRFCEEHDLTQSSLVFRGSILKKGADCYTSKIIEVEAPLVQLKDLIDLEEKIVKIARWPKCSFVEPAEARTVAMKQLIAVFSQVNKL